MTTESYEGILSTSTVLIFQTPFQLFPFPWGTPPLAFSILKPVLDLAKLPL